ncbi:hypothetical protein Q3G72_032947 [Acer saccharum]|nr:hypothetical protein Q3G72_032947 [Acer saccharum]
MDDEGLTDGDESSVVLRDHVGSVCACFALLMINSLVVEVWFWFCYALVFVSNIEVHPSLLAQSSKF